MPKANISRQHGAQLFRDDALERRPAARRPRTHGQACDREEAAGVPALASQARRPARPGAAGNLWLIRRGRLCVLLRRHHQGSSAAPAPDTIRLHRGRGVAPEHTRCAVAGGRPRASHPAALLHRRRSMSIDGHTSGINGSATECLVANVQVLKGAPARRPRRFGRVSLGSFAQPSATPPRRSAARRWLSLATAYLLTSPSKSAACVAQLTMYNGGGVVISVLQARAPPRAPGPRSRRPVAARAPVSCRV